MTNVYSLTQNQAREAIEINLKSNIPVLVTGIGGAGKSTIIKQIADKYNLEVIDVRLSQVVRFDLMGFPKDINGKMSYLPLDLFPLDTDPLPQGKDGWILFADEILQADKYTQGACLNAPL